MYREPPAIPTITVEPASTSSSRSLATASKVTESNSAEAKITKPRSSSHFGGRLLPLRSPPARRMHLSALLPPQIFVYTCIFLLFSVTFICFYLSLSTVTNQEEEIHNLEVKLNPYSTDFALGKFDIKMSREHSDKLAVLKRQKSKFLSLVVIALVSFPFHIFGMVAVTKRSFTLSLTYSIISFILLCLQLKTIFSLQGHYLTLWSIEFVLFALASLYCARLYCEKIRSTTYT